jgi:hypothetical protein
MRPMTMYIGVEAGLGLVYASPIPNAYLTQGDLWVNGVIDSGSQNFVMYGCTKTAGTRGTLQ